ncbi:ABC transporter permease [Streptomyces verrucosisporus]|uniref:ABC transporter permease n=1 Tax=Streptomyces verrucosisporus TaxID=1695161 RepID=UPI0019D0F2D2|nr:ABC transporter permease [Streptomyces verrucosisporus]MBN3932009.1 ABC transporter permease [Streptomyces verrucosisporus]
MTAVAQPAAATRRDGSRRDLAGTGALLRLALRRDRVLIPVWVLLLTVLAVQNAAAIEQFYPTAAERAELVASMNANTSMRAVYGPAFSSSPGGLAVWEMLTIGSVLIAIMSMIIVVRHTREEEETGRQELVSAAMVGRRAPLTSALLAAAIANAAVAALVALGLTGTGLPAGGSLVTGLALGGTGLVFAAVAALAAQLTESARLAKGLTGAVLGAAFVLRAAGDFGTTDGSSSLAWASPLAWARNARPFADERPWVPLLSLALAAVLTAAAYELAGRRDIGASFLATRPGPATGRIDGPYGLAWRLQRGSLLGWGTALVLAGLIFGAMAEGAGDLLGDNEQSREIIERMGGASGLTDAFLAAMAGLFGMITAIYAVGAVLRMRGEETSERAEPVLAGAVPRLRWAAGHLLFAFAGSAILLAACGLAMGAGYGLAAGEPGAVWRVTGAVLAQAPAVWALTGVAVLLLGAVPGAAPAAWGLVGAALVIGWLGPALDLPRAVMNLTPFTHLPKLPGGDPAAAPYLWILLAAAALTAAGLAAFHRRDIG